MKTLQPTMDFFLCLIQILKEWTCKNKAFYKSKKDYDGHHPTQKPVLLLEDLIKTFSNENDLVVDLTKRL